MKSQNPVRETKGAWGQGRERDGINESLMEFVGLGLFAMNSATMKRGLFQATRGYRIVVLSSYIHFILGLIYSDFDLCICTQYL